MMHLRLFIASSDNEARNYSWSVEYYTTAITAIVCGNWYGKKRNKSSDVNSTIERRNTALGCDIYYYMYSWFSRFRDHQR